MSIILLSGGSGKRLWPLSSDTLSKQFLKLLKNDCGEYESMVQRVMRQIKEVRADDEVFISCNVTQDDIIRRQLGAVETITEPSTRDTFPAIALAAAYLRYKKNLGGQETFVACPIDVFAENKYFELLSEVKKLIYSGKSEIGLLGAEPTYPSEKYGYILRKDGQVTGFIEKPTENEAARLISDKALWNCGVYALKIEYVLNHASRYVEFDSFETLYEQYSRLPKISIDYEIAEKEPSIGVTVYNGIWKDLGTWNTLTEEMNGNSMGDNVLISETCKNTHVLNMLKLPVVAQDISDVVVVASYDGILVTSKQGSSYLKPIVEQVHLRPMYEQRRWGNYRVLEYKQTDEGSSLIKCMRIEAGHSFSYQYHTKRCEVWVIVSGKGILTIEGVDSVVSPGNVVQIPIGAKHSLLAASDMELIEVQLGIGELEEEDIIRL